MFNAFFKIENDVAALILRVVLALVILPHGAQKLLGWFGGYGLSGTLNFFTANLGVPLVLALLVVAAESFGALGLLAGLGTRFCAFGIAAVMSGAILMVHLKNGFFMNWTGTQAGEGFEYHLLAIGIALALILKGGGAFSIDRLIVRKR